MEPEYFLAPGCECWIYLKDYKWITDLHEEGCADLIGQTATYKGVDVEILDARLVRNPPLANVVHLKLRRLDGSE
jgi:hypothetical protein